MLRERGRRWVLPLSMKLMPLRETEQTGGDKSMALFSQIELLGAMLLLLYMDSILVLQK